jgi:hypothetical protein
MPFAYSHSPGRGICGKEGRLRTFRVKHLEAARGAAFPALLYQNGENGFRGVNAFEAGKGFDKAFDFF